MILSNTTDIPFKKIVKSKMAAQFYMILTALSLKCAHNKLLSKYIKQKSYNSKNPLKSKMANLFQDGHPNPRWPPFAEIVAAQKDTRSVFLINAL